MTEFIYDYDQELKRQWAAEIKQRDNNPKNRIAALQENIRSMIAARIEEHPEEFDSAGDDPISRLSRRMRESILQAEITNMEIFSPQNLNRIRQEIAYENNVKKSLQLQEKILGTLS